MKKQIVEEIQDALKEKQDLTFRAFHVRIVPSANPGKILGVKTPFVREIAKKFYAQADKADFLCALPHTFYDEDAVHAAMICLEKDFDVALGMVEKFLPHVDNWAVCDGIRPKCFGRHPAKLLEKIKVWLNSPHEYTVRFGIEMLMVHFLKENFSDEVFTLVLKLEREEFYIRMMIAWFFATALVFQRDKAMRVFENNLLPVWVHNKAIQKARESFRVSESDKEILKSLKK